MTRHLVSGLSIESDVPLTAYRPSSSPADVFLKCAGTRPVPGELAGGRLVQSLTVIGQGLLYSTVATAGDRYLLRAHHHIDFEISQDLGLVEAWLSDICPPEMLEILGSGLLVSVLLALRGEFALHASTVEVDGRAVAFIGESGMGKSTLAAMACATGAKLVTDDLLRLDLSTPTARCYLGSLENRLRWKPSELSPAYSATVTALSVDGRRLLRPVPSEAELAPLVAIVAPLPDRTAEKLDIVRLDPAPSVMQLNRCLRTPGWLDLAFRQKAFSQLSRIAELVPVYLARLPWGPPFDDTTVAALLDEVSLGAVD